MPAPPFKADISRFKKAIAGIVVDFKKDQADIVNKALKDVGMRAMQGTDFATKEQIIADLYHNDIGVKLAAKRLKKRVASRPIRERKKGGGGIKKSHTWQRQVSKELKAIIAKRVQGIKVRRIGWVPAINALGHAVRSAKTSIVVNVSNSVLRAGGIAARGWAVIATPASPGGLIANAVYGVQRGKNAARSKIQMHHALQKAIAFVTIDRENYRRNKIAATLRKHAA